jgi:hypothetical protein
MMHVFDDLESDEDELDEDELDEDELQVIYGYVESLFRRYERAKARGKENIEKCDAWGYVYGIWDIPSAPPIHPLQFNDVLTEDLILQWQEWEKDTETHIEAWYVRLNMLAITSSLTTRVGTRSTTRVLSVEMIRLLALYLKIPVQCLSNN